MRTFISVEIDKIHKQKISELISCLKKANADVKWVNENQMHLTLKFLGDIDENKAKEISDVLGSISKKFNAFSIHLSKIGAFPSTNHPRVIWLGIDKGAEILKDLNENIETELERLGFKRESREFNAHLTLGRVRTPKNIPELTKLLKETDCYLGDDIVISEIILFQSTLTSQGAIYTKLHKAEFQTAEFHANFLKNT